MNLERGIIETNKNVRYILSVGHFFKINDDYCIPHEIKDNQKVLGIKTGNRFDFCYNIELNNGNELFGYIIKQNNNQEYVIQRVGGYNKHFYKPYDLNYKSLLVESVKIEEIKSIVIASF
jgi:hypothetical protein